MVKGYSPWLRTQRLRVRNFIGFFDSTCVPPFTWATLRLSSTLEQGANMHRADTKHGRKRRRGSLGSCSDLVIKHNYNNFKQAMERSSSIDSKHFQLFEIWFFINIPAQTCENSWGIINPILKKTLKIGRYLLWRLSKYIRQSVLIVKMTLKINANFNSLNQISRGSTDNWKAYVLWWLN